MSAYPQVPPPPPLNPSLPGDPAYPGRPRLLGPKTYAALARMEARRQREGRERYEPRLLDPQTYGPRGEYQRPAPRSSAPTPEQVEALMEEFRGAHKEADLTDLSDLSFLAGMDRALRLLGLDPGHILTGIPRRT